MGGPARWRDGGGQGRGRPGGKTTVGRARLAGWREGGGPISEPTCSKKYLKMSKFY